MTGVSGENPPINSTGQTHVQQSTRARRSCLKGPRPELAKVEQVVAEVAVPTLETVKAAPADISAQKRISIQTRSPSYFDAEQVLSNLSSKYGIDSVSAAINHLTENDVRFNNSDPTRFRFNQEEVQQILEDIRNTIKTYNQGEKTEQVGLNTLAVTDSSDSDGGDADFPAPGPESSETSFMARLKGKLGKTQDSSETKLDEKAEAKLHKKIGDSLVGFVERVPVTKDYGSQKLTQHAYHVSSNNEVNLHKTLSAELQKKQEMTELANQATVTRQRGETTDVLFSRSGRSDSVETVKAKSIGDIKARVNTTSRSGLTPYYENGYFAGYTYQRVDVSFMDTNMLKALATSAKSLFKGAPIENELLFLENKRKAIDKLWSGDDVKMDEKGPYIEHKIEHKVSEDVTEELTVREYKPLVMNHVFSAQAKTAENLKAVRRENMESNLEMANQLIAQLEANNDVVHGAREYYERCLTDKSEKNIKGLSDALRTSASTLVGNDPATIKKRLAIQGLATLISGKDQAGESCDHEKDVGRLYMYTVLIADVLNLPITIECKSGNDRTCTGVALSCALARFEDTTGRTFDPSISKGDDFDLFCHFFTEAVIDFGEPNILASRGLRPDESLPELKVKKSPPFRMYAGLQSEDKDPQWRPGLESKINIV